MKMKRNAMADVSSQEAAEKKPAREKKTKAPKRKKASHPPYFQMVKEALLALNEQSGSSPYAIAKYMERKYKTLLPANFRKILGIQLKNSAARGKLIKIKASYKLSAKKPAKKQPTEKKRSPMAYVSSSIDAEEEEEGVAEKNLKPYVYVPWTKENEKPTPEDEEWVMNDLFGYGALMMFVREKEKEKEKGKGKGKGRREEEESKATKPKTTSHRGYKRMSDGLRETCRKYSRQIIQSQGFDFEDFPGCSIRPARSPLILPYVNIKDNKWLNDLCCKALAEFNSLNGTRFEFVKVEKANTRPCAGHVVFVTFQARKPRSDSLVTFQARGYHSFLEPKKRRVHFCRLKKDARGPMDSELDQGTKSDTEAQYEAAAAGPSKSHSPITQRM